MNFDSKIAPKLEPIALGVLLLIIAKDGLGIFIRIEAVLIFFPLLIRGFSLE